MKKLLCLSVLITFLIIFFTGCGNKEDNTISVITREDGSGTRGAFTDIFGIAQKNADGNKSDKTIIGAETTNSTSVMITSIEGNKSAIGYLSLGSFNPENLKAVKIDGIEPTKENIKNSKYKASRSFNVVTKKNISKIANDFLKFILSENGQNVVEKAGYISVGEGEKYTPKKLTGKISVGGSSSVTPVMEKLKEAYIQLNPDVTIDLQQNDSTSGITGTIDGIYDIGMSSREIKESEIKEGLTQTKIAIDGIIVVLNKQNPIENLTSEQVFKIYTGEIVNWNQIF